MLERFGTRALATTALVLSLGSSAAEAQAWPTKAVTLVVPGLAGGSSDALARAVSEKFSRSIGQPFIVENKPGDGNTLGAEYVARAKPDGYTLLMGSVHLTIATSVYSKLSYDLEKDLAPITNVALIPNVLAVNANSPATSVKGLVELAKGTPGGLSFGSNGNGTLQHLIGTQFASATGVRLLHVPYSGSAPLTRDLLGGLVDMSFDTLTPVLAQVKARKLRALAVTTGTRSSALPQVPTLAESGVKDFDQGTWFGILAPAATPKEIIARLNTELVRIIRSPEFKAQMDAIGAEPVGSSAQEMATLIRNDTVRYGRLVKEANVVIE